MATVLERFVNNLTDDELDRLQSTLAPLIKRQSESLGVETPPQVVAFLEAEERRKAAKPTTAPTTAPPAAPRSGRRPRPN